LRRLCLAASPAMGTHRRRGGQTKSAEGSHADCGGCGCGEVCGGVEGGGVVFVGGGAGEKNRGGGGGDGGRWQGGPVDDDDWAGGRVERERDADVRGGGLDGGAHGGEYPAGGD